jgi:DNA-binding response OmpR family regulator
MAEATVQQDHILIVASTPGFLDGLGGVLSDAGFSVSERTSARRAQQLIAAQRVDAVLVSTAIDDGTGHGLVGELRKSRAHQQMPMIVFGDDRDGSVSLQAFSAQADDVVNVPFLPDALVARLRRHLARAKLMRQSSMMSMKISGQELPSVLQLLETENKSGRLIARNGEKMAVFSMRDGHLVNAAASDSEEGDQAVIDVLCWPTVSVVFQEGEVPESDVRFQESITGMVMNAAVAVDEFRLAREELADKLFLAGVTPVAAKIASKAKARIHQLALRGFTLEEIVPALKANERAVVSSLRELLEEGHLRLAGSLFADYHRSCTAQYRRCRLASPLQRLKAQLVDVELPLALPSEPKPPEADWTTTVPTLMIGGDNTEHVERFAETLRQLSIALSGGWPAETIDARCPVRRCEFGGAVSVDVMLLPPNVDAALLEELEDRLSQTIGVLYLVSAQDSRSCGTNLRSLRHLWRTFTGAYYLAVPQVPNKAGEHTYRIDCSHCGHKLAVDMGQAGAMGECPICNASLTIPDCLDHLGHVLKLPADVPAVLVRPHSAKHARDVLLLLADDVIKSSPARNLSKKTLILKARDASDILNQTDVRSRPARENSVVAQIATASFKVLDDPLAVLAEETDVDIDDLIEAEDTRTFDIEEFLRKARGEDEQ